MTKDNEFSEEPNVNAYTLNSFSAKGNIEVFANNTDSGESARNELFHLKSALFAFLFIKIVLNLYYKRNGDARF